MKRITLAAITLLVLTLFAADASAFGRRSSIRQSHSSCVARQSHSSCVAQQGRGGAVVYSESSQTVVRGDVDQAVDALAEVNAQRAARGLHPFIRDEGLTRGAQAAATFRAQRLMFGHVPGTPGDFGFLPPGVTAAAGGCAAYPASYGFMACATYENYRFAGAAVAFGGDGKRYCHLFVR